jgi:branched-subunit amino acid transport protein
MNELLLLAGMAAATIATRIPLLVALSRRKLPTGIERALRYVPPAVLAAIIVPMALLREGELHVGLDNAALGASMLAAVISWRTKNLLLTIVLGMAIFLAWRSLV